MDRDAGESGGGIAIPLGSLALGVETEGRPFPDAEEGKPTPMLESRPLGFGVLNGELEERVGEL